MVPCFAVTGPSQDIQLQRRLGTPTSQCRGYIVRQPPLANDCMAFPQSTEIAVAESDAGGRVCNRHAHARKIAGVTSPAHHYFTVSRRLDVALCSQASYSILVKEQ